MLSIVSSFVTLYFTRLYKNRGKLITDVAIRRHPAYELSDYVGIQESGGLRHDIAIVGFEGGL